MTDARGHVTLLATGGTVSAGPDGPLGAQSLIRLAVQSKGGIPEGIPVRGEDVACAPSSRITVESIERLASSIRTALDRSGCLGVVVTYGTDTMEEVTFACDLLLAERDRPVVFTGAMVPPKQQGTDAHANLAQAIRVAGGEQPDLAGVVVVMHHRVHAAIEVRKLSTDSVDAFASPTLGPIGWIGPGRTELVRRPFELALETERLEPRVELVRLVAGGGARLVRAASEGAKGLVVELFGAGNAGPDICEAIRGVVDAGTVVLVCSRVGLGGLTPESGVLESGALQAEIGAGQANGLTLDGLKARVLLMAALGAGLDRDALASAMRAKDHPKG